MSPLRSSAGPAVCTNGTSSSAATIWASEVLPRPGGPARSRWSTASPPPPAGGAAPAGSPPGGRRAPRAAARPAAAGGGGAGPLHPGGGEPPRVLLLAAPRLDLLWPGRRGGAVGDLLAQLDDDRLGRAVADPGHGVEAGRIAGGERREQLAGPAGGEHGERDLRPHGLHAEQHQEQLPLLLGVEPVERQGVVTDDQVGVQRHLLAGRWDVSQRLCGDRSPVPDATP